MTGGCCDYWRDDAQLVYVREPAPSSMGSGLLAKGIANARFLAGRVYRDACDAVRFRERLYLVLMSLTRGSMRRNGGGFSGRYSVQGLGSDKDKAGCVV